MRIKTVLLFFSALSACSRNAQQTPANPNGQPVANSSTTLTATVAARAVATAPATPAVLMPADEQQRITAAENGNRLAASYNGAMTALGERHTTIRVTSSECAEPLAAMMFDSWREFRRVGFERLECFSPTTNQTLAYPLPHNEVEFCSVQQAQQAKLHDRASGLEYVQMSMVILETLNSPGAIRILGWSAEPSDSGPPCNASFVYELNGSRRTVLFKYWPGVLPRLAPANQQAFEVAKIGDLAGIGHTTAPTDGQVDLAEILRIAHQDRAEDIYVDPTMPLTITVRRQHCVSGNVDLSAPESRSVIQLFRRNGIRRFRCSSDSNWTLDIPPRGAIGEPYIP